MTKYVVRKLDFGYLIKLKKKILYLNYFNRVIRFKNRSGLYFKRKFKIFINRISQYRKLKYLNKTSFSNIYKTYKLSKLKFRFSNYIIRGFKLKIKHILLKFKYINFNFIKKIYNSNFNNIIKFKLIKFLKKKKQIIRHLLRKSRKHIENIHNKRFKNKYIKLKLKNKIHKKFKRNFYKYIRKATKEDLLYLKRKIKTKKKTYNKIISINKPKNILFNKYKSKKKCNINFNYKKNNKNKIKTQKQKRKEYLFMELTRKTKYKLRLKKLNLIRSRILKIKKLNLVKINILTKFKVALNFSKNIKNFKIFLQNNFKYLLKFKMSKLLFKYLKKLYLNKKFKTQKKIKFKKKNLKKKQINNRFRSNYNQFGYLNIRSRKLKIKYYISKIYIVSNKYLKNILNICKNNIYYFFNINLFNINRYSNLNKQSNWIKFFFNFIFFYFFKFCNIKGLSKSKHKNKKRFINNTNYLFLDRPSKKSKINHIFETQNSFFFFRFIRLSKKILDLFLPIKQKYIKDNNVSLILSKNIIYYKFLLNKTNINLNNFYYQFNNINYLNILILSNFFFLIFCKVVKKKENILFIY